MNFEILIIILTIVLSAFFSGLEIAFISSNKLQLALEKKKEGIRSKLLSKLTKKPSKFITTMLIGNNISLVIYSFYMAKKLMTLLPSNLNEFTLLLLQTFISSLLILITSEFLPKAIFKTYANETLIFFTIPAYFFYLLFHFISMLMEQISDFILKIFFKVNPNEKKTEFSKEELGHYIDKQIETEKKKDEEIDSEIQMFQNALTFNTIKAREIMVPRADIEAIEIESKLNTLRDRFIKTGFSKILIYKNTLDNIVGYVRTYEMFKSPSTIKSILLPVKFIPESMMINEVLDTLIRNRKSIAIVIDEYGGTSGMITIEDIIEELSGEIEDEHDKLIFKEKKINDNEYHLSARLGVKYLNDTYRLDIQESQSYESLGGYIISEIEEIPKLGQEFQIDNFHIKILKVDNARIEEVFLKIEYSS